MPDPHRIKGELLTLLSGPQYASLFNHRNQFRGPKDPPATPENVAEQTANHIWKSNAMVDPVEVVERRGRVELYRAYDGGARVLSPRTLTSPASLSAGTLGRYWFERPVVEDIWSATAKYPAGDRRRAFLDFLRSANFILPEWNDMVQIAVMDVPAGASVVVVRGRGNWKAVRTAPGRPRPAGAPPILDAGDVMTHLGTMPIPGTVQCVVPIFNDNWVSQVPEKSANWPLLS